LLEARFSARERARFVSPGNLGNATCSEGSTECPSQLATAQQLVNFSTGLSLVQADNQITSNAYNYAAALTAATKSVPALQTVFPANNGLATQLKRVAQLIQVALAAFYQATVELGIQSEVTTFHNVRFQPELPTKLESG
jgi:hypothetical protein